MKNIFMMAVLAAAVAFTSCSKPEKTIENFFERDKADKNETLKSEKKAVPVKVDCMVAKEVFYQTA
ncbi:MAG: hypothetical protein RR689_04070, partial [Mucinivorans sp.]